MLFLLNVLFKKKKKIVDFWSKINFECLGILVSGVKSSLANSDAIKSCERCTSLSSITN